ncbi:MAG: YsnF/AvaK domain-containing protein [Flavisolibacter sp.]|nr:YsnF/AvaK domain-containing protein [Flavisolibacter sp.]MBD0374465.1 YsnF/AvaK domain-containing protein [Flavisolibacter sp.]
MAQTVVGFFDNASEAQQAVERLQSSGISQDRIDVSSGNAGTDNVSYDTDRDDDRDRSHESGITRFFRNLFGDDDNEAERYSRVASRSNSIVTVHAQSREEAERAADILDDCGAVDVDERSAQYASTSGRTGIDVNTRQNTGTEEASIPRIEEELNVGKRTVEKGGVRVRSRIVERPVEENIRLREENVRVERNPVDRPVSGDELSNFKEQDIELTERAEVPVVNKEARVVEEVRISKDVNEREETIRDNVRHTEIDVDNLNKGDDSYRTDKRTDLDDNTTSSRGI